VRGRAEPPVRGAPDTEQCMSGAAPDCLVPLEDKASNSQKLPNPNGWVMWLVHRTVSRGTPDYPVRPSTAACPNGQLVVEGYKCPHPPPLQPSKHSTHCIQYKSTSLQDTNQSNRSTQSPKFNSSALGLVRGSLVFLVALVCLVSFLFFSLLLSSAL
jgi:hypothetical protein